MDAPAPAPAPPLMDHAELVAHYLNEYPEKWLDGVIDLFAAKLRRPDLARLVAGFPARRHRGHLRQVLDVCTLLEIGFVGW